MPSFQLPPHGRKCLGLMFNAIGVAYSLFEQMYLNRSCMLIVKTSSRFFKKQQHCLDLGCRVRRKIS